MWSAEGAQRSAAVVAALLAAACASNTAPSGFLPSPQDARASAYGAWIELTLTASSRQRAVEGELLAGSGAVAGWTALGVVSTISNGLLLIFTAPAWIITGTVAGSSESYAPQGNVPPLRWAELARFARFPQGMPPGLVLNTLKLRR